MKPGLRYLRLGLLAGLTVSMLFYASGIPVWALPLVLSIPPVWALPYCMVLVVFAGQTSSVTISGKTLNFKYDPISNMITTNTVGTPGRSSFPPNLGSVYEGSDWGDCTEIMVTLYFVVFFFRPLTVLKLMGIENGF
jgi:hypothetical protein